MGRICVTILRLICFNWNKVSNDFIMSLFVLKYSTCTLEKEETDADLTLTQYKV